MESTNLVERLLRMVKLFKNLNHDSFLAKQFLKTFPEFAEILQIINDELSGCRTDHLTKLHQYLEKYDFYKFVELLNQDKELNSILSDNIQLLEKINNMWELFSKTFNVTYTHSEFAKKYNAKKPPLASFSHFKPASTSPSFSTSTPKPITKIIERDITDVNGDIYLFLTQKRSAKKTTKNLPYFSKQIEVEGALYQFSEDFLMSDITQEKVNQLKENFVAYKNLFADSFEQKDKEKLSSLLADIETHCQNKKGFSL